MLTLPWWQTPRLPQGHISSKSLGDLPHTSCPFPNCLIPGQRLLCSHCKQPNQLTQTDCQPELSDSLLICLCVCVRMCLCLQTELSRRMLLHDSIWPLNPFEMMSVGMKLTHSFKLLIGNLITLMRKKGVGYLTEKFEVCSLSPI